MADSRQQFDNLLGGQSHLPSGLNILHIISARAQEIEALTEAIDDPQRSGLIFQRLPKHMRRRIMSHNVKRLPRRLRQAHLRQMEKCGFPPKTKRPSRKYRRRPSNLLQEYNRRQRKFIWLETHIWHAKRFHMMEKWGYKLPHFPNDKSFRACYRASANHCLLQDISYYCCIELHGPLDELLAGLKQHTDSACGLTFAAKDYLSGSREGNITVFRRNSYPCGAIGNVSFLWRPSGQQFSNSTKDPLIDQVHEERTLWMWVHPSFYEELHGELVQTFNFVDSPMDVTETVQFDCARHNETSPNNVESRCHKRKGLEKNVEVEKLTPKTAFCNITYKYESKSGNVKMKLLKDMLNRFRLTGPLSHCILQDALHIASVSRNKFTKDIAEIIDSAEKSISENLNIGTTSTEMTSDQQDRADRPIDNDDAMDVDEPVTDSGGIEQSAGGDWKWWDNICSDVHNLECIEVQKQLWEAMRGATSPAQIPPHSVMALVVMDPRCSLPTKRMKPQVDFDVSWPLEGVGSGLKVLPLESTFSPLWMPEVRDAVTNSKPSSADVAHSRSSSIIPVREAEESDSKETCATFSPVSGNVWQNVPILLLQRPGSQNGSTKRLGFGCGWDIIVPAGWAMPFWLALVFRGARVGGLREATALSFEGLHGPWGAFLAPDTNAGILEDANIHKQLYEAHFRLPPDKRPNFATLGIASPFACKWDLLTEEWCNKSCSEDGTNCINERSFYILRDKKKLQALTLMLQKYTEKKQPYDTESLFSTSLAKHCLVPVCIAVKNKGVPSDFSIICVPTDEDLKNISATVPSCGPMEPLHGDCKREARKHLQCEHKKKLKSLRKQRYAQKRKLEDKKDDDVCSLENKAGECTTCPPSNALIEEHAMKMRELWLPDAITIRKSCSREVIGFIYKGSFSFSEGIGMGLGYVPLPALLSFIKCTSSVKPWVLVRNTCRQQYRYALLHIHSEL